MILEDVFKMSVKLYNDDCFNVLPDIDDNSVDLICIDPPYNIQYATWDTAIDYTLLFSILDKKLRESGAYVIFQGWSTVTETIHISKQYGYLLDWIVFDRIKGRGAKNRLVSTREDILHIVKNKNNYTFNKIYSNIPKKTKGFGIKNGHPNRALSNVWTDISPVVPWSKERVAHPTQKPLALLERILTIYTNKYDTVLDCFAGSGTTGVACTKLERSFIGVEIDPSYFKIMEDRVNEASCKV